MRKHISPPVKITREDVQRSSTLDLEDVGYWAILVNGCIMLFGSEFEANDARNRVNAQ